MGCKPNEDSGNLWIEGDLIRYESHTYGSLSIPIDQVRLVGEATNENGPYADDYFLCFATDSTGWMQVSCYATGLNDFLRTLADRLDTQLPLHLTGSTQLASRIIWPSHLADQPMFDYTEVNPKGFWKRVRGLFASQCLQTLSHAAKRALSTGTSTYKIAG